MKPSFLEFPFLKRSIDAGVRNIVENLLIVNEMQLKDSEEKVQSLKDLRRDLYARLFKVACADFSKQLETKWLECAYSLLNSHTNRLFMPIIFN